IDGASILPDRPSMPTTRTRSLRLACAAVLLATSAACSSGSPTKATAVTVADFGGQYSGTYHFSSCTTDGLFAGFCDVGGFTTSSSLPMTLSLTQTSSSVTGPLTLGSLTGQFQGTVAGSTLTGTATMNDFSSSGSTLNTSVSNWSTTLTGTALSGGFNVVFHSPGVTGSATLTATIDRVTR